MVKKSIYQPDIVKLQNPYYWVFIIGIFSGMRTNEICQLKISDIQLDDGVWVFNIDEELDKSVKTQNSVRRVPIHPTLMKLGFLDYYEIIKSKSDRLFQELKKGRDGYSSKPSRHFNENFTIQRSLEKTSRYFTQQDTRL